MELKYASLLKIRSSSQGTFASRGPLFPIGQCNVNTLIKRFIVAAVGKIHELHRERLRELGAPWLTKK